MADLNGDGAADRVSAPSPPGDDLTLTFGAEDGRVTKVRPRDLVGHDAQDAEDVLAVVADFDRDGWNDLFVVATPESGGDDPRPPDVSELRLGPFSARGRGQSDHHVSLSEPRALAVADYNHDRYPDLASYGHQGDGVYEVTARLGGEKGLNAETDATNRRYSEDVTGTDDRGSVPQARPTAFQPPCDGGSG
ncbi:VCBS repeat-containing protein [Streptomyces sp. OM5714]|uniref:FG-GAP repeat domain-containing protein n=1 Tax=Streptomyces sp. OM5714 TaxID=2602736 RepID=UPI0013D9A387|nr:VCBS repeat-containing protein [Streptomyces sp. OM5714]KAF2775225.1 hypothetical protein STPH1_7412 [Streptomyces sp. OM5714]